MANERIREIEETIRQLTGELDLLRLQEEGPPEGLPEVPPERFVAVYAGISMVKHVTAWLGKTNLDQWYLLSGSLLSPVGSDAATLSASIVQRVNRIRQWYPLNPDEQPTIGHDFRVHGLVDGWKVALATTTGAHRWEILGEHHRLGTAPTVHE